MTRTNGRYNHQPGLAQEPHCTANNEPTAYPAWSLPPLVASPPLHCGLHQTSGVDRRQPSASHGPPTACLNDDSGNYLDGKDKGFDAHTADFEGMDILTLKKIRKDLMVNLQNTKEIANTKKIFDVSNSSMEQADNKNLATQSSNLFSPHASSYIIGSRTKLKPGTLV